uniref:Uncharacterized protein n=1 Tax=Cyclophora tenuis TaxID=216820 RepID=A0A7S1CWL0_CYCTE
MLTDNNNDNNIQIKATSLPWGNATSEEQKRLLWMEQRIRQASNVLLVGADIIYRKSLFDPLLVTMKRLLSLSEEEDNDDSSPTKKKKNTTKVQCLLATQSIRQHLNEFWDRAEQVGFLRPHHVASVVVEQQQSTASQQQQQQQQTTTMLPEVVYGESKSAKGPGIVHILEVRLDPTTTIPQCDSS